MHGQEQLYLFYIYTHTWAVDLSTAYSVALSYVI